MCRYGGYAMNKTVILIILCAILIASALGCRTIPSPRPSLSADRDEAWAEDIGYLRDSFPKYNRSFDERSLYEFQSILDSTYSNIPTLSDNEIYVDIMRAVAAAEDGHTSVNMAPSAGKLRRFPVRFYWFEEGLFIVKASSDFASTLGGRVRAINGTDPEELVSQLEDIVPGGRTAVRYESSYLLNSPDFLHGMGAVSNPESVPFKIERPDGTIHMIELPALPLGEKFYGYQSWRELSPLSRESQDSGSMEHVLRISTLPPFIAAPNRSCSYQYFPDHETLYVQINQNTNLNSKMSDFAGEIEDLFSTKKIDSVIVDLRFNTGGNLLLTTDLVKGIPEWHSGKGSIYIITGGPTFSAGIVTAARMKYYAGDRAVIAGEPAAEGLQFWAETRFFTLPNSEIRIFAAHAYHNWEDRNYDSDKQYFWLMRRVGVPAGDIDVDLLVEVSFADYLSGRDTVLDTIFDQM